MRRLALLAGAAFALAGCDLNLTDLGYCEYSREFSDEISASGLDALLADVGPGRIRIDGHSGTNRVRVHAHACARDRRTSEDIDFDLYSRNGEAHLEGYVPDYHGAYLDLDVEVPADFDVFVQHYGRGDVQVSDVYGRVQIP